MGVHNKIEYLKDRSERIPGFEMEGKTQMTNSYGSCFCIDGDMVKTRFPMTKESMEKKLKECGRLFPGP